VTSAVVIATAASAPSNPARAPAPVADRSRVVLDAGKATVVVRDTEIGEVLALGHTVLYGRGNRLLGPGTEPPSWWRLVDGRRLIAHLPVDSYPVSIGRDRAGRVVAIVVRRSRSWIYDIDGDSRRPLPKLGRAGCTVDPRSVSIWRTRIAFIEQCEGESRRTVVLREHGRARRVASILLDEGGTLFLRGRSLVAEGAYDESAVRLWRILDRGRRCPAIVDAIDPIGEWDRRAVSISRSGLQWALSDYMGVAWVTIPFTPRASRSWASISRAGARRRRCSDCSR
jgi:hypothetical protein